MTAEYRAGGTDLMERRASGRSTGHIIDLYDQGLRSIEPTPDGGFRIGAMVTVDTLATDPVLAKAYPALSKTAGSLATPQIRRAATVGGVLLQKTRCRYYRNEHYECLKTGGTGCPARDNPGERAVVLDVGPCVAPHPSSVALAMLIYDAVAEVDRSPSRRVADLYSDGARDHLLEDGELLTAITLPPPVEGERAGYKRAISRASAEWPLAEAVAHLTVRDGVIIRAGVAVGGVAAVPLRLAGVEQALTGQPPSEELFTRSLDWTAAFPETAYKIPLAETLIRDVLTQAL
ncbi:FAD binding domain-containing protein [Herbidospora mongoliensis]|uniref:FAD binding domain-containing protein n=1 Tax=Herbidospora mongoliensis TaxID=688067 RepID=UPI000836B240|nr:FAD binding domain-containing protein [Herbidospora mongoliensis]